MQFYKFRGARFFFFLKKDMVLTLFYNGSCDPEILGLKLFFNETFPGFEQVVFNGQAPRVHDFPDSQLTVFTIRPLENFLNALLYLLRSQV